MSDRLSLKVKLPIVVSITMTVVILILAGVAYSEVQQAQLDVTSERLRRVSGQLATLTTSGNEGRLSTLAEAAERSPVRSLLSVGPDASGSSEDEAASVLEELLRDPQHIAYRLVATDGTVITRSENDPQDLAVETEAGPSTGKMVPWQAGLIFSLSTPVYEAGDRVGSLVVWRQPSRLDEEALRMLHDLLGAPTGIVIGTPGYGWSDLQGPIDPPPVSATALAGVDEPPSLVQYRREGVERFGMATALTPLPWTLLVELPAEAVLAPSRAFLVRLMLLSPFAVLAVAMSAWYLGRTIARSLRETSVAAEAIADGKQGHRVPVRGNDELGRLAQSFNSMAQQIEDTQHAMEDLNASLRTMLDGAPLPIIVLDRSDRVRLWNRAAERTFGWSREEVLGRRIPFVSSDGTPLELPDGISGTDGTEARVRDRHDRMLDLHIAAAPTYAPTGRVDGRIIACDDITARKRQEQQLARYAEELARSNAELENFAYVASHDLREPLRMVRSFTGLLAERYASELDEVGERYISFAYGGAQRMDDLIKALLEYSRVEGAGDEATLIDSGPALKQALDILGPTIRESEAAITHGELPEVLASDTQLTRVFQNLIANAIKFSGDEPPEIHISALRRGDRWVFSVQDNGIGIDPVYHDRIFQIFKRLHGHDEYEGTGMGLSICKKIVETHGGRIWVDSKVGEGSCFHFTLPARAIRVA